MNVAEGHLEQARTTSARERKQEHLAAVASAHDQMHDLIEAVLTIVQAGDDGLDREAEAVGAVAEQCWQAIATGDANLTVQTDHVVDADAQLLHQLIVTLVENAVEHGGETVTVRVGEVDDPPGFYVADDGPVLLACNREAIFELGYATATTGTGVGLNVVNRIADLHGWSLAVTSGERGGARIEITTVDTYPSA